MDNDILKNVNKNIVENNMIILKILMGTRFELYPIMLIQENIIYKIRLISIK